MRNPVGQCAEGEFFERIVLGKFQKSGVRSGAEELLICEEGGDAGCSCDICVFGNREDRSGERFVATGKNFLLGGEARSGAFGY